jgi:hypothetical protein
MILYQSYNGKRILYVWLIQYPLAII